MENVDGKYDSKNKFRELKQHCYICNIVHLLIQRYV